jgi:soluble lytic murein transglycosylase-like protein
MSALCQPPGSNRFQRGASFRPLLHLFNLFILLGIFSTVAHAQLTSYVDERGTLVFTNADKPLARKTASAKTAPSAAPGYASTTPSAPPSAPLQGTSTPFPAVSSNLVANPVAQPVSEALDRIVLQTAQKNHVDPALVRAVISTESNWNSSAVSSKGALGLMQLIPDTARQMGVGNAFDPAQNVDGGVRYLRMLLERYNGDLSKALAAYNAGPGAVDRFGGVPNFRETRDYVRKVTDNYYRPGSAHAAHALEAAVSIYRSTDASGHLVFTNE